MDKPAPKPKRICGTEPIRQTLKRGVYFWCACGWSKKQPYCDGSHQRTLLQGLRFAITEEEKQVALCACKHTSTPPYCDGSHAKLSPEQIKNNPPRD